MTREFLEKLRKIDKDYFTLNDLAKIWQGKKAVLKVILSRLIKANKLKKIQRNVYILPEKTSEIEKIANELYSPSYLSFESALSRWGILSQIPYTLTFAAPLKTKTLIFDGQRIEYRQLKKELIFGFLSKDGLYIAEPEKVLLDTFYLASMGKLKINFENLEYDKIKKRKLLFWLKNYPLKTKQLLKKFLS